MSSELLLIIYCVLILLVSTAGGLIPLVVRLTHQRMQLAISLVAGVMLGVGLLHMLPHALLEAPDHSEVIFACVLGGFLTMFFIERFFCFHHHDVPMPEGEAGASAHNHAAQNHGTHNHEGESHRHEHASPGVHGRIRHEAHRLGWVGASIGLTLHTIIAGIALAASIEAESGGAHVTALAGFGTFVAIFLHKPFDAMTITTLMTVGARKKSSAHLVNGLFALMIPVGVGLFYLGLSHASDGVNLVAYALAFSAGTFLCVSMSDLLPELQFHAHDRVALSVALLLGLSVAGGVGLLESQNNSHAGHGHSLAAANHGAEHEHGHARQDACGPASHEQKTSQTHRHHDEGHDHAEEGHAHEELGHGHTEEENAHAEEGHGHEHAPSAMPEDQSTDAPRRVSQTPPFSTS
jgi:zinc and cadmium transporter